MGNNYLKSLFALAFQGFLIMVCVAIYAVLVAGIATSGNLIDCDVQNVMQHTRDSGSDAVEGVRKG